MLVAETETQHRDRLYPQIEIHHRDRDSVETMPEVPRISNLHKNYNQIFMKGPALTKGLIEKVHSEIVPKKTYMFGYELKTKKILFISGLFLLFFTSLFGTVVMWLTDIFVNAILSTMVISNTSQHFEMWKNPSPTVLTKIYLFNYTNIHEYETKFEKKLHVQEVGPYVYEETAQRTHINFNEDDTVSYQDKRTYKFRPELSKGRQNDRINAPNLPLLIGAAKAKYQNYFARLAFTSVLTGLSEKPFITLAADSYVFGYDDHLFDMAKSVAKLNNQPIPDKIGLYTGKAGEQPTVFTMNTGKKDINKIGVIEKINGKKRFDSWSTQECDSVKASDGVTYPPKQIQSKQPISYVFPQMCRSIPMRFEKEVTILDGKIPAYKYSVPEDVFDSADEKPENQCYCSMSSGDCPLKGVFNITSCAQGAPLFFSHPHFHNGDESLINGVTGLRRENRGYGTHANIHPTMGFIMTGTTTFQVNIQVQKAFGVYQMDMFEDKLMLPLFWAEITLGDKDLPEDYVDIIYQATFTLKGVNLALKYGCLLTSLVTLICIILVFTFRWQSSKHCHRSSSSLQTTGNAEYI